MKHDRANRVRRGRHVPQPLVRRVAGWTILSLGLLGLILPVLPGVVLFGLGIVILGPHDPALRQVAIGIRVMLRRWSRARHPRLRQIGRYVRARHRDGRLALRMQLHHHAQGQARWSSHLLMLAFSLIGVAVTATTVYVILRTIP